MRWRFHLCLSVGFEDWLGWRGNFCWNSRKKRVIIFGRRDRLLGKSTEMLLGYSERKLERQKHRKSFIWVPLLKVIIYIYFFTNILTVRRKPRRISILYWMRWGTLPPWMRKWLGIFSTFSTFSTSVFNSQIVSCTQDIRPPHPPSWKIGMGSRMNSLQFERK